MTKKSILIRKMHKAYKSKKNWDYSRFKDYPENTYFGYASFDDMKKDQLKSFIDFYGNGLKELRIETVLSKKR